MELKWIATAAMAAALVPAAALAQSTTGTDTTKSTKQTTTTTSTGDVSSPGGAVTSAMLKAQEDASHIGTPAWWKTHATADGKPLNAESKPKK
jgi:hypothetical protein